MAIILQQINGLSDSKYSGIAGSVAECVGLDIVSTPGLTKVRQKLTKISSTTVDAFVKVSVACSNGYSFWFSFTSGKIWAISPGGTLTLAYTTVPGAGTAGCSGAMEHNGYLYWATQSRLHRISIANADDSWASVSLDWATFTKTDADFHPMATQDLSLFIGDGNQVALVDDAGVFNANALDINTPYRIKSMIDYETDILLGTFVANTVNKTQIIRWDTVSPSWNTSDPVEEVGINAFIRDDNNLYVNAGRAGNIYFYNGQTLELFKKIPGDYSDTKHATINPGSVANHMGVPVFGLSNGLGNPAKQGVYSLGSHSKNYPKVLSLDWVISPDVTANVEVGAMLSIGGNLLISWKNNN